MSYKLTRSGGATRLINMTKNDVTPTERQKRFVKKYIENAGQKKPAPLRDLAIDSGYSEAIANVPQQIMKAKGVVKLFEEAGIKKEDVTRAYKQLMDMPIKEEKIAVKDRLRLLEDMKKTIIDDPEQKTGTLINYIDKFLHVDKLGMNKPKSSGQKIRTKND